MPADESETGDVPPHGVRILSHCHPCLSHAVGAMPGAINIDSTGLTARGGLPPEKREGETVVMRLMPEPSDEKRDA
jgi:hypothetical protein